MIQVAIGYLLEILIHKYRYGVGNFRMGINMTGCIIGSFRKIMHSTKEYNPEDSISLIIYLFKMFSSFFFGGSFMYSIRGTS